MHEDMDSALVMNWFLYTAWTGHVLFQFTSCIVTSSGIGVGQEVTGTGAEITARSGDQPSSQTHTRGSPHLAQ